MDSNTFLELREALREIHTTYSFGNMLKDPIFLTLRKIFINKDNEGGILIQNDDIVFNDIPLSFRVRYKDGSFRLYFQGPSCMSQLRIGKETHIVSVSYAKGQPAHKDKLLVDDFFADVTDIKDHEADLMEMVYPHMVSTTIMLYKCMTISKSKLKKSGRFNGGK